MEHGFEAGSAPKSTRKYRISLPETVIYLCLVALRNLEKENKSFARENRELVVENNKLQDDVFSLQKQRQEMQTEIGELQILVEDLKVRLSQTEADHKQLQEEEQELLAKMNVRLCFVIRSFLGGNNLESSYTAKSR